MQLVAAILRVEGVSALRLRALFPLQAVQLLLSCAQVLLSLLPLKQRRRSSPHDGSVPVRAQQLKRVRGGLQPHGWCCR